MTARGFFALFFGAVMLVTALSCANSGAFLLSAATLAAWAISLAAALFARLTFSLTQGAAAGETERGLPCRFHLTVRMASLLPVAPLSLRVTLPSGRQSEFTLAVRTLGETASVNEFACPHVGVFPVGVTRVRFRDCFGFFRLTLSLRTPPPNLVVLPGTAGALPLAFSPGEGDGGAEKRALSDHNTPDDTRAWQEGDELRRVHWKLSMRKQTLMVRTYETPQRPDALLLLDYSAPSVAPALRAAAVDALTEGCAGVARLLLEDARPVRLPLAGKQELGASSAHELNGIRDALARQPFTGRPDFARTLYAAAQRMRRAGAAVILTTSLTPAVADAAIALARTGPATRFCLYTEGEPDEEQRKLLRLLLVSGVETAHAALRPRGGKENDEKAAV